ncbi:crustacyanin subunit C [Penaeus vannamei]|uniref:Crustacyanin subunit C n=1 Tax=Penaeus vannamei TaxID=6689 RepID=A0A423U591_PENVA|nr:crustacyanin-C1 subunit-like [Penaeus vannamei]ROT83858.1 crustacyanin subunit C [Penaeus vannamei]
MKSAVFFVAFVAAVAADKIPDFLVPGKCPAVNEKALFEQQIPNHSKYAGVWYEIALTNNPYQLLKQCVRNEYSFDGSKFIAKSTGINADGNLMRHNGQVLPMPLGDPHLSIDYEGSFTAPYVILDTDYENFSCIYSCVEFNYGYYADFAFIFSRSPKLSDQYLRRCEAAFKEIGVDVSRFAKTVQGSNCPYDTQKSL